MYKFLKIALVFCIVCSLYTGAAYGQTTYFTDDFSAGAGNWTENAGTWAVQNGEYRQSSTNFNSRTTLTGATYSNFTFEADLKCLNSSGEWGGILFRKTNAADGYPDSGYLLYFRPGGAVALYKGSTSTYLVSDQETGISFYNSFKHVKIIANGTSIKVYVNNAPDPAIEIADATYASGYISLAACANSWSFDNVRISDIVEIPKDVIAYKNMNVGSTLYSTDFANANNWTPYVGTWAIENGEYSQSSTGYYDANSVYNAATYGDCIIEADLKCVASTGNWGGITFRKPVATGSYSNGYLLYCTPNGQIALLKDGATYIQGVDTGINFNNTFVHVKIIAQGSHIRVFVNNEASPRISVIDTAYTSAGYISLNACSSHWHFDNFSVKSFTYNTNVSWTAVTGASGYNLYKRTTYASDGHHEYLPYVKVNSSPITTTSYSVPSADDTYRVTALFTSNSVESGGSDMVFGIEHFGTEPLSIEYLDGNGNYLKTIPVSSMNVKLYVINATGANQSAILRAQALKEDGTVFNTYSSNITLTGDGKKYGYNLQLTGLTSEVKSIKTVLYSASMNPISTTYYFKPLGTALMDSYYERGGTYLLKPALDIPYETTFSSGASDWTPNSGTWAVENGEYSQSSTYFGSNSAIAGKTFSDVSIEADLKCMNSSGEWGGINFGKTNAGDNYSDSGYLAAFYPNGDIALIKNGSTYLATANTGISFYNTFTHVKIATGTDNNTTHNIKIYINGELTPRISYTDLSYPSGYLSLNACANHWHFDNVKITSLQASRAGTLSFGLPAGTPEWDVASWYSNWNWIRTGVTDPAVTLPDGSVTYTNKARTIERSPNGDILTIASKGSVEYSHTRLSGEGWPHLLLSISNPNWIGYPSKITIADANSLIYTADARMLQCENKTAGYDSSMHAGQFVMFFYVKGINGEGMWYGISGMDNRIPEDENSKMVMSAQMDAGTNTMMIFPPHNRFWSGHFADGQWHTMSIDLKPLIQEAFNYGKTIGAFSTSSFSDLHIDHTNSGFELPGSFDMEFQMRNFQLVKN